MAPPSAPSTSRHSRPPGASPVRAAAGARSRAPPCRPNRTVERSNVLPMLTPWGPARPCATWVTRNRRLRARRPRYSHSMVAGGLLVMSYTTRFTAGTSFTMRFEMRARTS